MLAAYRAATWIAAPGVALAFTLRPAKRPMLRRFRPAIPTLASRPVWIHACSVGEVNTARPIIAALRRRWPDTPLLLTVSTPTGHALAESALDTPLAWFPLDHPLTVRRFLRRARPQALLLIETELWPNVLAAAHRAGIPVAVVNGRLSDAHARAYHRLSRFWRPLLRPIQVAAVQNAVYADRFTSLGLDPARVTVTGNIKFDAVNANIDKNDRAALRDELQLPHDAPVLVFGSTRPGDEALAARCWEVLAPRVPGLRLIVAPRHLDRLDEAQLPFQQWPIRRRSRSSSASPQSSEEARILFLDTHGELGRVYSIATVAVIGGSFSPGIQGHNPLEPAAQGIPAVFGPHMRNFQDIAEALLHGEGAVQVPGPEALTDALARLFADAPRRNRLGEAGRRIVLEHQGATDRTLDALAPLLPAAE